MIFTQQETKLNRIMYSIKENLEILESISNESVKSLKLICKNRGLSGYSKLKKAALVAMVSRSHEKALSALRFEYTRIHAKIKRVTRFEDMLLTGETYRKPARGF